MSDAILFEGFQFDTCDEQVKDFGGAICAQCGDEVAYCRQAQAEIAAAGAALAFAVGDLVVNFGTGARVVGIDWQGGAFVLTLQGVGDDVEVGRWIADPAKTVRTI